MAQVQGEGRLEGRRRGQKGHPQAEIHGFPSVRRSFLWESSSWGPAPASWFLG